MCGSRCPPPIGWADSIGRDLLSRMIWGGRVTIFVAACATLIAFITGVVLGFLAAVAGGWVDQALSRLVDLMMSIPAPPGTTALLSIRGVTARYPGVPVDVLRDITLDLAPGQTLAVVGESGSGKSTLARAITGLLPPTQGEILFDGRALPPKLAGRSQDDLRELQMIYQMADTAMNPRQTVGTIIGRPLQFYFGLRGAEKRKRILELLEEIELGAGFADRYPAELSGGQKQRVCIARALAAKPRPILCDEVTSALDPLVADGILKLLLDLQREEGVAYLFITHDLATVRAIADQIAVMYRGKVVRSGPKAEVLAPPFDDYTDLLLSSAPEMRQGWLEEVIAHRKMAAGGN